MEESANKTDDNQQKEVNLSHEQTDPTNMKSEDSQDNKDDKSEPTSTKQERSEVEETKTEIVKVPDENQISENVKSDISSPND